MTITSSLRFLYIFGGIWPTVRRLISKADVIWQVFFLLNFRPVAQQIDRASTRMHRLLFAWTIGALPQYHPVYSGLNRIPSVLAISRPQSKSTELPAHQHLRAPLTGMLKFMYSEKATKFCEISTNYLSYIVYCFAYSILKANVNKNRYVEFLSNHDVIFGVNWPK